MQRKLLNDVLFKNEEISDEKISQTTDHPQKQALVTEEQIKADQKQDENDMEKVDEGEKTAEIFQKKVKKKKFMTFNSPKESYFHFSCLESVLPTSIFRYVKNFSEYYQRRNSNYIRTTKYTLLTFVPVNLFEQLRRISNLYFIIIMILMLVPGVSPIFPITSILPIIFIMGITMIKDILEDLSRYYADLRANGRKIFRLDIFSVELKKIQTANIGAGDILKIENDSEIPCDMIVLYSKKKDGSCFVQTANLDGETNLKKKQSVFSVEDLTEKNMPNVLSKKYKVTVDENNSENLEEFEGKLCFSGKSEDDYVGLNIENLLLRGSVLKNTSSVIGIATYVGKNTKMFKNLKKSKMKWGKLDKGLNYVVIGLLFFQQIIIFFLVIGSVFFEKYVSEESWYLERIEILGVSKSSFFYYPTFWFSNWMTFFILIEMIIPMSLFVTMEIVKTIQAKFMEVKIKHQGRRMVAKTSNLNWDLANIDYIFSDKTGTLTQNRMEYVNCFCEGKFCEREENIFSEKISEKEKKIMGFFLLNVCINNSVTPNFENEEINFDGESTDEVSLVKEFALFNNFRLQNRTKGEIEVEYFGEKKCFKILHVLEFNSDRKRMSVIVRDSDENIIVFSKGADSQMLKRARSEDNITEYMEAALKYSNEGLRTLVFSSKTISEEEYTVFKEKHKQASVKFTNKEEEIEKVYNEMEQNFVTLGVTAILDELQEGVPEALDYLLKAGINVWVLTGDKTETAINICYSANVIKRDVDWEVVFTKKSYGEKLTVLKSRVGKVIKHFREKENLIKSKKENYALVVDSLGLQDLLTYHKDEFIEIVRLCKSVICCRVTPLQKAIVTELVQKKLKVRGLAIGDGANDVSMIQKAYVGIGVMGREGSQATRASDYAIPRFKYLVNLLAVEGRYCYIRSSECILSSFSKNITLVFTQFLYLFFNGLSAQTFFDSWVVTLYNLVFHAVPPVIFGFFEKDIDEKIILKNPSLYKSLKKNPFFNKWRISRWILTAVAHSTLNFFMMFFIANYSSVLGGSNTSNDIYLVGHIVCTTIMITIYFNFAMETKSWNILTILALVFSFVLYCIWTIFTGYWDSFFGIYTFYYVPIVVLDKVLFYMYILFTVSVAIIPIFCAKYVKQRFWPSLWQKLLKRKRSGEVIESLDIEMKDVNILKTGKEDV